MSDLHGENEAFVHILNSASGVIREKVDLVLGEAIPEQTRAELATLIYYPNEKLPQLKNRCTSEEELDQWYTDTLLRLIDICRLVSSKHTRDHVRQCLPASCGYILDELLHNFSMNEDAFDKEKIRHHVQLCDTATHKVFYDKLEYIYVEISKFNKPLEELDTLYEKWLYALKNLYKLTQRPKELCDKVFDRLFEEAEIAKFTPQEMREYETSKMAYRDIKNSVDTAKREGIAEGMEKGMKEGLEKGRAEGMNQRSLDIARNMLADGVDINQIMKYSGLTQEQIEKLK